MSENYRKTFFTSDPHFEHSNILKLAERPFNNVHEMNEEIIKRHNSVVTAIDLVYVLGDLTLGHPRDVMGYFNRLNGKKIHLYGNHDSHKYKNWYQQLGFIDSLEEAKIMIANEVVMLNHYPYRKPYYLYLYDKIIKRWKHKDYWSRPKNEGNFLLHGHSHSHRKYMMRQINVGLEAWDYYPVEKRTIEDLIIKIKREE